MNEYEIRSNELGTEVEHLENKLAESIEDRDELTMQVEELEDIKRIATWLLIALMDDAHKLSLNSVGMCTVLSREIALLEKNTGSNQAAPAIH